jgi:chromosomal replication initiator protein
MEKDEGSRMRSRRDVFDPVSGSTSSGQTVAVRCTLHGFVIGECNRSAHAMAVNVAEGHCSAWLSIMYGDVGLGKTHLLKAVANGAVVPAHYESWTSYAAQQQPIAGREGLVSLSQQGHVVLLDDVRAPADHAPQLLSLAHALPQLRKANVRVVLAMERHPSDHAELVSARDLLSSAHIVELKVPDAVTRFGILRQKAAEQKLEIPDEMLAMLAETLVENVCQLEGALHRFLAALRLSQRSGEMCRPVSGPGIADSTRVSRAIVDNVCRQFGFDKRMLLGKSRSEPLVRARHIAAFLLREDAHLPLSEVGRQLGGRDHSTALHSWQKASRWPSTSGARAEIDTIRELVAAQLSVGLLGDVSVQAFEVHGS